MATSAQVSVSNTTPTLLAECTAEPALEVRLRSANASLTLEKEAS
jgi:hypothetical protein